MCVMLQDIVLDFSPGPIHAVDGDRGLSSPVSYAILSGTITHRHNSVLKCGVFTRVTAFLFLPGNDDGCLLMDKETAEMRLIQGVEDRLATPTLHLQVTVRLTYSGVGLERYRFPLSHSPHFLCLSPRRTRTMTPGSMLLPQCWSVFWLETGSIQNLTWLNTMAL